MPAQKLAVIAGLILCPIAAVNAETGALHNATTQTEERLDITTLTGLTYTDCRITRVEPDGITVFHATGIAKIAFRELPDDFRVRYNYNPTNATAYARAVNQQQAQARARRLAQKREVAAAEERMQFETLVKDAVELHAKALTELSQKARDRKAFTSDCRILIGCTKATVSEVLGTPYMTFSKGSTWIFDHLIDPESGRYTSLHVSFERGVVDDVYW